MKLKAPSLRVLGVVAALMVILSACGPIEATGTSVPGPAIPSVSPLYNTPVETTDPLVLPPTVTATQPSTGEPAEGNGLALARLIDPNVPAQDLAQLVEGNTVFAFDLYRSMRSSDGNLFFSPFSISLAFAMVYAGARGETASQMADVLHFTLPEEQLHPAFDALDLTLVGRPDQAADDAERFQLNIANSWWGQAGLPFLSDYLNLLTVNYGAELHLVDFQNASESASRQINDWVSGQTNERIKEIVSGLDPSVKLLLVNAIYFKANWMNQFDASATTDVPFTLLNNQRANVSMMSQESGFGYAAGVGWQAVALPYMDGLTEMMVIVPDAGNFQAFESNLTADRYYGIVSEVQYHNVILSMPKFTFETTLGLADRLVEMGMPDAFDKNLADFSGMNGQPLLCIGAALHKAFIAVDENGTEAAAVTAIMMIPVSGGMPETPIVLTIDRPFFFIIRDISTGTVLFMGRVVNPL